MINNSFINMNKKQPDGIRNGGGSYQVLVVDDSGVMRKMVSQILKSQGYEICGEAKNGQEAIEKYKELNPDLITLDINMPQMSGIEALEKIIEFDKEAQVVMLSSEGEKNVVMKAISKGAKNFIVKPPERSKVLERMRETVSKMKQGKNHG